MKRKRQLNQLWLPFLCPLLFGANINEKPWFSFLENNIGPFVEDTAYEDTLAIGSNVANKEVNLQVGIYLSEKILDCSLPPDWSVMEKKTSSFIGEKLIFSYEIPKEMVRRHFKLCFTISYSLNSVAAHSFSHVLSIRSKKTYSSKTISCLEEATFEGTSIHEIGKSDEMDQSSYFPTMKVIGAEQILESSCGAVPFSSSFLFSFYDDYNHMPLSFPLSKLGLRLDVVGDKAKDFVSFCDEYETSYLGEVASFHLEAKEIKKGSYRLLLPAKKFTVNRYNGVIRKSNVLSQDEVFTREIILPYQKEKDQIFMMRLVTTFENEEFNIPLLSSTFYCYQEANPFGNFLNSDYCVKEIA